MRRQLCNTLVQPRYFSATMAKNAIDRIPSKASPVYGESAPTQQAERRNPPVCFPSSPPTKVSKESWPAAIGLSVLVICCTFLYAKSMNQQHESSMMYKNATCLQMEMDRRRKLTRQDD